MNLWGIEHFSDHETTWARIVKVQYVICFSSINWKVWWNLFHGTTIRSLTNNTNLQRLGKCIRSSSAMFGQQVLSRVVCIVSRWLPILHIMSRTIVSGFISWNHLVFLGNTSRRLFSPVGRDSTTSWHCVTFFQRPIHRSSTVYTRSTPIDTSVTISREIVMRWYDPLVKILSYVK